MDNTEDINTLVISFLKKYPDTVHLQDQWRDASVQKQLRRDMAGLVRKAKKDPRAPKRPTPAYFMFSEDVRPTLAEQYPGAKMTELSKKIGVMWNEFKHDPSRASEYDEYQRRAEEDKARYEREMRQYGGH